MFGDFGNLNSSCSSRKIPSPSRVCVHSRKPVQVHFSRLSTLAHAGQSVELLMFCNHGKEGSISEKQTTYVTTTVLSLVHTLKRPLVAAKFRLQEKTTSRDECLALPRCRRLAKVPALTDKKGELSVAMNPTVPLCVICALALAAECSSALQDLKLRVGGSFCSFGRLMAPLKTSGDSGFFTLVAPGSWNSC